MYNPKGAGTHRFKAAAVRGISLSILGNSGKWLDQPASATIHGLGSCLEKKKDRQFSPQHLQLEL